MTRKNKTQTTEQTSTPKHRRLWAKPRREPSRSALISFARVGLLGTQFV